MKMFVSSLIATMEPFRAAATAAIRSLGHEPITAESFGASAMAPRVACLSGVRESAVVVLIAGSSYGATQPSGLSATHEEYLEARGQRPVLVFVQSDVDREPAQARFVREVEDWENGNFRAAFSTPEQLKEAVVLALHRWELSAAAAPVDAAELLARACSLLPEGERRNGRGSGPLVHVAVVGGPQRSILRPVEIERPELIDWMLQEATFGEHRVFDRSRGSNPEHRGSVLTLSQDSGAVVTIDEQGALRLSVPIKAATGHMPVIIDEHVSEALDRSIGYAAKVLEHVDPAQRISRVVIAARPSSVDGVWRTRAEHDASPSSASYGAFREEDGKPTYLHPPDHPRAALMFDRQRLVEDLTALLRRKWR